MTKETPMPFVGRGDAHHVLVYYSRSSDCWVVYATAPGLDATELTCRGFTSAQTVAVELAAPGAEIVYRRVRDGER